MSSRFRQIFCSPSVAPKGQRQARICVLAGVSAMVVTALITSVVSAALVSDDKNEKLTNFSRREIRVGMGATAFAVFVAAFAITVIGCKTYGESTARAALLVPGDGGAEFSIEEGEPGSEEEGSDSDMEQGAGPN